MNYFNNKVVKVSDIANVLFFNKLQVKKSLYKVGKLFIIPLGLEKIQNPGVHGLIFSYLNSLRKGSQEQIRLSVSFEPNTHEVL